MKTYPLRAALATFLAIGQFGSMPYARAADSSSAGSSQPKESAENAVRQSHSSLRALTPAEVMDQYKRASLAVRSTPTALCEQAISTLALGKIEECQAFADEGLAKAENNAQRSAFWAIKSQCYAAKGDYAAAGMAALQGHRCEPNNRHLASYRFGYFSQATALAVDEAERAHLSVQTKMAEIALQELDPNFSRKPVCDPVTLSVVVGVIAIGLILDHIHSKQLDAIQSADSPEKVKALERVSSEVWSSFRTFFASTRDIVVAVAPALSP